VSVTHGQCDARPAVTFPAYAGANLYCLVTEAHVCVNNLPSIAPDSAAAESQTRDL